MTSNAKRGMDNKRLGQVEKNLTGHSFETLQSSTIPTIKQLIGQFIPNDTLFQLNHFDKCEHLIFQIKWRVHSLFPLLLASHFCLDPIISLLNPCPFSDFRIKSRQQAVSLIQFRSTDYSGRDWVWVNWQDQNQRKKVYKELQRGFNKTRNKHKL